MDIVAEAKRVFATEIQALQRISERIGPEFSQAVKLVSSCRGRIILTGMGKSGIIARKISATLSSLGTPSFYIHPSEAMHGDLGMILSQDLVIALGKSGETDELNAILPAMRKLGVHVIAITGNTASTLAKLADTTLDVHVEREACPNNLAPTTSTTAALVMGDALAVCVSLLKGIRPEDFALFHPGGQLGKRLTLRVRDLMHGGDDNPVADQHARIRDILAVLTANPLGGITIIDQHQHLVGLITDGDIRRALMKYADILEKQACDIMTRSPITICEDELAVKAMDIMENRPSQISVLPVVNQNQEVTGLIRLHDLVKAGL